MSQLDAHLPQQPVRTASGIGFQEENGNESYGLTITASSN